VDKVDGHRHPDDLVILVTMVYGPIAAMLVEMFPTRIRYTSMSLPYHIGNGWFGGLLPTTFAIVAANGNMYYGLWYPIVIAAVCFVIGICFVRRPRTCDIYAGRIGRSTSTDASLTIGKAMDRS
jgi:hypothetical protein